MNLTKLRRFAKKVSPDISIKTSRRNGRTFVSMDMPDGHVMSSYGLHWIDKDWGTKDRVSRDLEVQDLFHVLEMGIEKCETSGLTSENCDICEESLND